MVGGLVVWWFGGLVLINPSTSMMILIRVEEEGKDYLY